MQVTEAEGTATDRGQSQSQGCHLGVSGHCCPHQEGTRREQWRQTGTRAWKSGPGAASQLGTSVAVGRWGAAGHRWQASVSYSMQEGASPTPSPLPAGLRVLAFVSGSMGHGTWGCGNAGEGSLWGHAGYPKFLALLSQVPQDRACWAVFPAPSRPGRLHSPLLLTLREAHGPRTGSPWPCPAPRVLNPA